MKPIVFYREEEHEAVATLENIKNGYDVDYVAATTRGCTEVYEYDFYLGDPPEEMLVQWIVGIPKVKRRLSELVLAEQHARAYVEQTSAD